MVPHSSEWLSQRGVDLSLIEADYHTSVDYQNRSGHVAEFFQLFEGTRVCRNVPVFKWNLLLRKILLRLATKHSSRLRINHDTLHGAPPAHKKLKAMAIRCAVRMGCMLAW